MFGNLFGGIKNIAVKKLVKAQLKNLPKNQREMIETMVDKNPELFTKIAKEAKELTKNGMDQTAAMMQVSRKYQGELQKLLR